MEKQNPLESPGKEQISEKIEPVSAHQSWENPLLTMSLEPMALTVHQRPSQPPTEPPSGSLPDWQSEKIAPDELRDLLGQIKRDMEHNVNERKSLREKRRAAREKRPGEEFIVDVPRWRKELQKLMAEGRTDIEIGYWRVSTAKQKEAEGPQAQIKDVLSYSIAKSGRGVDLWCFDIDSGREETRDALDFLLEAMATGAVRSVTAQRLDRFARNNYLAECLHRTARSTQVSLVSATEHIPDGPVGTMFRQILQALAQYEAALIVARLSGGKRIKKERDGTWGGGEVPYGYWGVGEGRLIVCEPEARIIRLTYSLYEMGYNQSAIADALNRWGIPTRKGGRLGWRQGQIRRILRNEAKYRAEALFSETVIESKTIAHPPILPTRPKGQRSYLHGTVRTWLRTAVPDDLALGSFDSFRPAAPRHPLNPEQAISLKTMYALHDSGLSIVAVQNELNRLGLKSMTGKPWKYSNVQAYLSRRDMYSAAIAAVDVTAADMERATDPSAVEAAGVDRITQLRSLGLSYPKIRERLQREGLKTATGADWSISSIHRVVNGKKRATAGPKG